MEEAEIEQKFLSAFDKLEPEVNNCRKELVELLENYIRDFRSKEENNNHELLIVNTPESRIKHRDRFWAKFIRNDYLSKWNVEDSWSDEDYKKHLRENLTDFIGLRIICYFQIDEKKIFKELSKYIQDNQTNFSDYHDDTVVKCIHGKQPHDITIYKLQALYNYNGKKYGFEIQIKSMANDLWGEVDHEVVYKTRQYQYDDIFVKEISNNLHKTLLASDTQLSELFQKRYKKENLINSLFYLQTEKIVFDGKRNDKSNKFYHEFFDIFDSSQKLISDYVAHTLLKEVDKNQILNYQVNINPDVLFFCDEILDRNFRKELLKIKKIAQILYKYEDDKSFINHVGTNIMSKFPISEIDESDIDEDDKFNIKNLEEQLKDISTKKENRDEYLDIFKGTARTEKFKCFSHAKKNAYQNAFLSLLSIINKEN